MPDFLYEGKHIYYEEHGSGGALILLNGIFMTCASWAAFIPAFSVNFRLVLVDLLDQGRSGRASSEYTQDAQVELVRVLYERLGLEKAHLLGISYGGEVATRFAAKYPEMLDRLVLSNTVAYTSPWMRDIGKSWEYGYESNDGRQFFKTCIPVIYSPEFYENNYGWMERREAVFTGHFSDEDYAAFGRLTRSSYDHDARAELGKITAPTLIISSEHDFVTPADGQKYLAENIKNSSRILIPGAGHAVMYEKPVEFASAVVGFLGLGEDINIVN